MKPPSGGSTARLDPAAEDLVQPPAVGLVADADSHPADRVLAARTDPDHLTLEATGSSRPGKPTERWTVWPTVKRSVGLNEEPAPGEILGCVEAIGPVAEVHPEHERSARFGSLLFRGHEESLSLTSGSVVPYEARAAMAAPLLTAEEQRVFDDRLAEILAHYPSDRKSAAMLPALRLLQSMKGWLPPDGMEMVARKLEVTPGTRATRSPPST